MVGSGGVLCMIQLVVSFFTRLMQCPVFLFIHSFVRLFDVIIDFFHVFAYYVVKEEKHNNYAFD
jgi:hypothetical protein